MKRSSISKTSRPSKRTPSRTDWPRLRAMGDGDIDVSEVPEVTRDMAAGGELRIGGKAVPRGKRRLTMYLDAAIVEFFKARAGTRGYQTLINETLKQAIERESLEDTLRRVIREEQAANRIDGPGKGAADTQSARALGRMQTSAGRAVMEAAFNASPDELGRTAVKAARRTHLSTRKRG